MTAILDIPLAQIRPMATQPREYFAPDALRELAESIAAIGQVVPAQVVRLSPRVNGHAYELVDGERRLRAARLAGLATLRAEVLDEADTEQRFLKSVIANLSREPNHHMEIARAVERLRRTMTVEAIAEALGKSKDYVGTHLRLLELHPDLQAALHPGVPKRNRLPVAAAVKLAGLAVADQIEAYTKIAASDLSLAKATEAVVGDYPPPDGRRRTNIGRRSDARRVLLGAVRRFGTQLAAYDDARFGALFAGADAVTRARLVLDLGRLAAEAQRLLDRASPPVTA